MQLPSMREFAILPQKMDHQDKGSSGYASARFCNRLRAYNLNLGGYCGGCPWGFGPEQLSDGRLGTENVPSPERRHARIYRSLFLDGAGCPCRARLRSGGG